MVHRSFRSPPKEGALATHEPLSVVKQVAFWGEIGPEHAIFGVAAVTVKKAPTWVAPLHDTSVGTLVGAGVGAVGEAVGESVGLVDGKVVGTSEPELEPELEPEPEPEPLPVGESDAVGATVGADDGTNDGVAVGGIVVSVACNMEDRPGQSVFLARQILSNCTTNAKAGWGKRERGGDFKYVRKS